jgi:hypothetical protein
MKWRFLLTFIAILILAACDSPTNTDVPTNPLIGTWETTILTGFIGDLTDTTERLQFTETECYVTYIYPQDPPEYPVSDITVVYYYNDSDIFFLEPLNYPAPYIIKNDLLYIYFTRTGKMVEYTPVR